MKTGICTDVISCHDDFTVCVVTSAFFMTSIEKITNIMIRKSQDMMVQFF